jgi:hypothetical protein
LRKNALFRCKFYDLRLSHQIKAIFKPLPRALLFRGAFMSPLIGNKEPTSELLFATGIGPLADMGDESQFLAFGFGAAFLKTRGQCIGDAGRYLGQTRLGGAVSA